MNRKQQKEENQKEMQKHKSRPSDARHNGNSRI